MDVKKRIEAIRHRLDEYRKHCNDPYAYYLREIPAVRTFDENAVEDVAFLLLLVPDNFGEPIHQEEHFGHKVWVSPRIEALRESECLCLNCGIMKTCPIAKKLFNLCVKEHMAMAITRCFHWKPVEEEEGVWVLHHDDPPCNSRLINGYCPVCNLTPDMQSTAFHLYCPNCNAILDDDHKCSKCGQTFKRPNP